MPCANSSLICTVQNLTAANEYTPIHLLLFLYPPTRCIIRTSNCRYHTLIKQILIRIIENYLTSNFWINADTFI
jgi:hypothetical protein